MLQLSHHFHLLSFGGGEGLRVKGTPPIPLIKMPLFGLYARIEVQTRRPKKSVQKEIPFLNHGIVVFELWYLYGNKLQNLTTPPIEVHPPRRPKKVCHQ